MFCFDVDPSAGDPSTRAHGPMRQSSQTIALSTQAFFCNAQSTHA
jgi:hypothetical protein